MKAVNHRWRKIFCVALSAVLFALCSSAEAQQQKKIPRIGYLALNITTDIRLDAFRQGLRQLGYAEGKDIVIESRSADGKVDRLNELATELVRLKVDVIVTRGRGDTRRQSGNFHYPHCYDAGPRPRGQRVRR